MRAEKAEAENADLRRRLEGAKILDGNLLVRVAELAKLVEDEARHLGNKLADAEKARGRLEADLAEAREEYKNAAGLVAYQVERISKQDTELAEAREALRKIYYEAHYPGGDPNEITAPVFNSLMIIAATARDGYGSRPPRTALGEPGGEEAGDE